MGVDAACHSKPFALAPIRVRSRMPQDLICHAIKPKLYTLRMFSASKRSSAQGSCRAMEGEFPMRDTGAARWGK